MDKLYIVTIDEEFRKSRVKSHIKTRKGKMYRVKEHERKGKPGQKDIAEQKGVLGLTPKELKVMTLSNEGKYSKEIGKELGVNRERVFQILAKARRKLSKQIGNWKDAYDKKVWSGISDEEAKDTIERGLERVILELFSKNGSIKLGGYAYTPTGPNKWEASDGSPVTGTLASIIKDYGGVDAMEALDQEKPEETLVIKKTRDQAEFESENY